MKLNLHSVKSSGVALSYQIIPRLYFGRELSCSELSEQLNKSIPLISKTLATLVKEGYVIEKGHAPSNGGRRPQLYALPSAKMYMVAVAMDQLFTRIVIMDMHNHYLSETETVEISLQDNPGALSKLIKSIRAHIKRSHIKLDEIIGIGIAMPGFVNVSKGINYTFLNNWEHESLRDHLSYELEMPCYIDNDSSLIALAELRFGLARNRGQVMVINVGWGIGLGMIINGELFRGYAGYAGEFSHIPLSDNDILCECGKRGCLETETSLLVVGQKAIEKIRNGNAPGMEHLAKEKDPKYVCDAVIEMANKGDQFAVELIAEIAYKLGKGIATLIHILNPELIVFSGRGAKMKQALLAPIQQALNRYCIPRLAENTELKVSKLGYDAELIGAATLVVEKFGIGYRTKKQVYQL